MGKLLLDDALWELIAPQLPPPRPRGSGRPRVADRGRAGSKHHVLTDAQGIPLVVTLTGANDHDVTQLLPLVDGIPPLQGRRGSRATGRTTRAGTRRS